MTTSRFNLDHRRGIEIRTTGLDVPSFLWGLAAGLVVAVLIALVVLA